MQDMAAKPLITPQPYNGLANWTDWSDRFTSIAEINGWDAAAQRKWLRVSLVGRAATAYKRLSAEVRGDITASLKALKQRFEPESKQTLYMAELNSKRKRAAEDWATFGEDLLTLAEKAYPDLEAAAQERLALNQFLTRIDDPQLSFAVRQKQPKTVDAAVQAALELQSYLPPDRHPSTPDDVAAVELDEGSEDEDPGVIASAAPSREGDQGDAFAQLLERFERMESDIRALKRSNSPRESGRRDRDQTTRAASGPIICRKCKREGHFASGCAVDYPRKYQGNGRPSQL